VHGDLIGEAPQLRRERLDGSGHEQGVRCSPTTRLRGCSARRFRHPGGVGVHANDEPLWLSCRGSQDVSAVAGSQVDADRREAGGQFLESADVQVPKASTHHQMHPTDLLAMVRIRIVYANDRGAAEAALALFAMVTRARRWDGPPQCFT
jgi:hypothetical protein